jgi:hypothetical protein
VTGILFGGKALIPSRVLLDWGILGRLATFLREVQAMSAINGDKARLNRQRRQKIARRMRNRELLKKLPEGRRSPALPAGKTVLV